MLIECLLTEIMPQALGLRKVKAADSNFGFRKPKLGKNKSSNKQDLGGDRAETTADREAGKGMLCP